MSIQTTRTLSYSTLVLIALAVVAFIPIVLFGNELTVVAAVREPLPWWQRVDEIQNFALRWISALTAIIGALAVLIALIMAKIKELKDRIDRGEVRYQADTTAAIAAAVAVTANADLKQAVEKNLTAIHENTEISKAAFEHANQANEKITALGIDHNRIQEKISNQQNQ